MRIYAAQELCQSRTSEGAKWNDQDKPRIPATFIWERNERYTTATMVVEVHVIFKGSICFGDSLSWIVEGYLKKITVESDLGCDFKLIKTIIEILAEQLRFVR